MRKKGQKGKEERKEIKRRLKGSQKKGNYQIPQAVSSTICNMCASVALANFLEVYTKVLQERNLQT
jgi:hypothetical protein